MTGRLAGAILALVPAVTQEPVHVNVDNYARAESDRQLDELLKLSCGVNKWYHFREPVPVDNQPEIRINRELTVEKYGTPWILVVARTFVDPNDPDDLTKVHAVPWIDRKAIGVLSLVRNAPSRTRSIRKWACRKSPPNSRLEVLAGGLHLVVGRQRPKKVPKERHPGQHRRPPSRAGAGSSRGGRLGAGEPMFTGLDLPALGYDISEYVPSEAAMHVVINMRTGAAPS